MTFLAPGLQAWAAASAKWRPVIATAHHVSPGEAITSTRCLQESSPTALSWGTVVAASVVETSCATAHFTDVYRPAVLNVRAESSLWSALCFKSAPTRVLQLGPASCMYEGNRLYFD
jgi:hypothetical protein